MKRAGMLLSGVTLSLALALGGGMCPVVEGDDDTDPPGPTGTLEERLVDAYINYYETCLQGQNTFMWEVEPQYLEVAADFDAMGDFFRQALEQQLESAHVTLDASAAERCITFANTDDCAEGFGGAGTVCDDIFIGDLSEGAACNFGTECAGDSDCRDRTDTECGTCMANAGAGENCSERSCIDGYHCDFSGASPACIVDEEEPPEEEYSAGDSCDTDGDRCGGWINSGLACVDDNDDGLGTCTQVQIAEPGEACAFTTSGEMTITCRNGSMGSYYCMVDITSGVFSGTCERRPGAGEPCVETFNFCDPVEAYCDYVSGNCVATIPIGGACDPSDRSCAYGSTCDHEDLVCRDMMQFDTEETLVCG